MPTLWIVHRDAVRRAVLARLSGAGEDTILGDPLDRLFEGSPPADVILLGLAGDFEEELEFTHRYAPQLPRARWILVVERGDADDARRLFDTLDAEILPFPPTAESLRSRLRSALSRRAVDPLSERRARDAVAARFARWFSGLELPELLRALDPRLARTPVLIRGEAGTGRALLARYLHAFGGSTGGALVQVDCDETTGPLALLAAIGRGANSDRARTSLTIVLTEIDRLEPVVQREVRTWVELGAPPGVAHSAWVRFIGTAQDPSEEPLRALDPCLEQALAAIPIRLPPLRESPDRIITLVEDATLAFCEATDSRVRHFAPDALALLRSHPWPGNVSELEAVIGRTLASTSGEVISAASLRFQSEPLQSPFFPERASEAAPSPAAPAVEPTPAAEPVAPIPRVEPAAPRARFPAADAPVGRPEFQLDVEGDSPELATWRFMDERQSERAPSSPSAPVTETPPGWTRLQPVPAAPAARPSSGAAAFRTPPAQLVSDQALRRFLGAVSHELGDSMAPLRTSAELLPERFTDPEFRALFGEIVQTDSRRIEGVLTRLSRFASFGPPAAEAIDLSALLDGLIEEERAELEARQILLLRELERAQPVVTGDPVQLRFALEALLRQALQLVKVRGDLYLASRFHPHGLRGAPSIRVLLRFQSTARVTAASTGEGVSLSETALDLLLAEAIVRAHGGRFTLDAGEGAETVTLIDLAASPTASA